MGWNTGSVFVNVLALFCVLEIVKSCNIRELNNVIEEHFKKELLLKKCAKLGQSCQLDRDCCKHLECKMGVTDDGIVNVCKAKEIMREDASNSGMNIEDYQEKTGDPDGNMDWMNNNNPPDTVEKKEVSKWGNDSDSAYSDESETILQQTPERDQDKKEKRRQKLIRENEELEKLFTEKEEREIEQLKALKEDEEIDELRKLRELKIKRKLQLLKELQELRSLKANDDFQNILEYKERRRLNNGTIGQNRTVKGYNETQSADEHSLETQTKDGEAGLEETNNETVIAQDKINASQERPKDENDDIEDQTKEAKNEYKEKEGSGDFERKEEASGDGEKERSGNEREGSGNYADMSGNGEGNVEASGNGEERENIEEGSANGEAGEHDDGTGNVEASGEGASGDGDIQGGEMENGNEGETISANMTTTRPNDEVTNSTT